MNGGETRLLGEGGDICVLAPAEVGGISELTEACDWWSFGSLLYELLTGTVSGGAGCGALVGVTEDRMAWAQYSQPMWGSGCLVLQSLALGLGVLPAQLPLPSSPPQALRDAGSHCHPGRGRTSYPPPILVAVAGETANFSG